MSMLITERAIINPQRTTRVRRVPVTVALPEPITQAQPTIQASTVRTVTIQNTSLVSKLGDRQSWLLLSLILIPVAGAIYNFMTFGLAR